MRNLNFDPDNVTSIPDAGYEVRDHLTELAIAIVSSKLDLSKSSYEDILRKFDTTIRELHDTCDQIGPFETDD